MQESAAESDVQSGERQSAAQLTPKREVADRRALSHGFYLLSSRGCLFLLTSGTVYLVLSLLASLGHAPGRAQYSLPILGDGGSARAPCPLPLARRSFSYYLPNKAPPSSAGLTTVYDDRSQRGLTLMPRRDAEQRAELLACVKPLTALLLVSLLILKSARLPSLNDPSGAAYAPCAQTVLPTRLFIQVLTKKEGGSLLSAAGDEAPLLARQPDWSGLVYAPACNTCLHPTSCGAPAPCLFKPGRARRSRAPRSALQRSQLGKRRPDSDPFHFRSTG